MFFKATYILVLLCADFKLCIGIQTIETRMAMDAWFTALNDKILCEPFRAQTSPLRRARGWTSAASCRPSCAGRRREWCADAVEV